MAPRNILLTGLPRSGTTLACNLLGGLPDVVALHEPLTGRRLSRVGGPEQSVEVITRFVGRSRRRIRHSGVALTKQIDGAIPRNISGELDADGRRLSGWERAEIAVPPGLAHDFVLIVKEPAGFTALLPMLVSRFECFAVIRNPLAVLASWNTVAFPVARGWAPVPERLDPDLRAAMAACESVLDRQIHLLSWYFERYRSHLTRERILGYEEIVSSGGGALAAIVPDAAGLNESLNDHNLTGPYPLEDLEVLAPALLETDGAFWDYYSRDDVRGLLHARRVRDGPAGTSSDTPR